MENKEKKNGEEAKKNKKRLLLRRETLRRLDDRQLAKVHGGVAAADAPTDMSDGKKRI